MPLGNQDCPMPWPIMPSMALYNHPGNQPTPPLLQLKISDELPWEGNMDCSIGPWSHGLPLPVDNGCEDPHQPWPLQMKSMHACMHMKKNIHMYMYIFIHDGMHACMSVGMYACMHVCKHACLYVSMHLCMYVCMHVCMYACMHV